jgi:hypothetical protein
VRREGERVNWGSWLLWGFVATLVLSTAMAGAQGLGLTRMNIPYLLGTMFTPDRDRARLYGFAVHLLNGFVASLVYVAVFVSRGKATWWFGTMLGLLHGLLLLVVGMALMPGVHPRMASEEAGPTAARKLEPPGFLAMNYGARTPVAVLVAHALFGAILGGFYVLR